MKYLTHSHVDKHRYDECIEHAVNGLIYARSFYLDVMCPQWDAIVADDYSWVMPVTHKRKWGIRYLYQPPFCQQLGVFTTLQSAVPWNGIIAMLQRKYWFWEINFNYANALHFNHKKFIVHQCTNFTIRLKQGFEEISAHYTKDLVKNLNRSRKFDLIYRRTTDYVRAIEVYRDHYSSRMKHVHADDYNKFREICRQAEEKNMIICREVVNNQNELLSIILLLADGKRLYNIMNTTTAAGKKVSANHFLLHTVIHEFSGKPLILDLEGSDLEGVKNFYDNFGGVNEPYEMVKYNNLPWPLRLLK